MKQAVWSGALALGMAFSLCITGAFAGVVITGTRVVYKAEEREVTVKISNPGKETVLVQAWADTGNEKSTPDEADAPFLIMPPIFRMGPQSGQALRVSFTGADLPKDRESVFWLNILDIPSQPKASNKTDNFLQMAFRSRIKLFYRPAGLAGKASAAAEKLSWSLLPQAGGKGYLLRARNPSAYHVSLAHVKLLIGHHEHKAGNGMLRPGDSHDFLLEDLKHKPKDHMKLNYESINDFGAVVMHSTPL
ncbi:MAG: fimbrial biogenesis chaperone, partial [Iodobacter sp.]